MTKLDNQNRIYIPSHVKKDSKIDFSKPVYFYLTSHDTVFLDNALYTHRYTANLGKAYIDKSNRLYIPKIVRETLRIDKDSNLVIYCYRQIFIHKHIPRKRHL